MFSSPAKKQQTVSVPLPDGSGRHGLLLYPVGFPVGLLGAGPLYALRSILQLDAPGLQLVPDAVCLGKVLCRTGSLTLSDQILDLCVQILGLAVVEQAEYIGQLVKPADGTVSTASLLRGSVR